MEALLQHFQDWFEANADPEQALPMKAYMRNKFAFYGIKSPARKVFFKQSFKQKELPIGESLKAFCKACYDRPQREWHYLSCVILQHQRRKLDTSFIDFTAEQIQQNSWWDTVDILAPHIAGYLFEKYPSFREAVSQRWIASNNIWLQRSAILFQLNYREKTDADLLFKYILQRKDSKEFFVQKAAGWALREYSKLNGRAVKEFVGENELPALTTREGLKWMKRQEKRAGR